MVRIRKTQKVCCSSCHKEYEKRVDTLKNWNGLCRTCTNHHTIENHIKGVKRAIYNKCSVCGKESYWIRNSGKCIDCRLNNMPKGQSHYKWKKDRTTLVKRQERNDMAYKEWRRQVWERDNYRCQLGNHLCNGKIEAHHIVGWSEDESKRYDTNNGITLCHRHHPKKKVYVEGLKEIFISIVNDKN
jgi:hypothetical protein